MADDKQRSKKPSSLRNRIRYHMDNLLARGTWAVLLWLFAITLLVVIVSALLLNIFGVTFTGDENSSSWFEDFWQSGLRTLDPGTMASDEGWGQRLLALLVTMFGILIAGTLIGIIASAVEQRVDAMKRGRSAVVESGHVVVLGASARLTIIVEQLALAGRTRRRNVIVVLADCEPSELGQSIRAEVEDLHGSRLVIRVGDPSRPTDLALVGLDRARTVIVLANDDADSDAAVVRTTLAAHAVLGGFDRVPLVVEVTEPITGESLIRACGQGVHPVMPTQTIARVAAFTLRQPGLNQVIQELMDYYNSDLHLFDLGDLREEVGELINVRFAETLLMFDKARPIGVMHFDGTVDLNPDPTRQFVEGDRLIMIADDRRPPAKSTDVSKMNASDFPSRASLDGLTSFQRDSSPEHVLILGWNALGPQLVRQLASICAPGSTAEVLYDSRVVDEEVVELPSTIHGLELTSTATRVKNLQRLAKVSDPALTSIILLGYRHDISPGEADSRTLLTLMLIRQELQARGGAAPRLIVELLDAESVDLAITSGADDFVVSNTIASRFMTQLAELPERRTVMMHLYADEGGSIDLIDASALGVTGQMEFHEMVRAVYSFGLLAIGWRRNGDVTLNPAASDRVDLGTTDQVVVITK
jgi:voltage-gated potassium channel Kch